jgi:hypothetical protein
MSNIEPTQVCSAPVGRKVISTTLAAPQRKFFSSIQPFEKADKLLEQKLTGGQFH